MADWIFNIADKARKIADGLTESIVAQATAAQNEIVEEQRKLREESHKETQNLNEMPWETDYEKTSILSEELKSRIFDLSKNENNFICAPPELIEIQFRLEDKVSVIMKLLELDSNLAKTHAKLSPKMEEEVFWKNYFTRVQYLRGVIGVDGMNTSSYCTRYFLLKLNFNRAGK